VREGQRFHRSKRIPDGFDVACFRSAKQRLKDGGKDMCVLVCIEVRDRDSSGLQLAKLRRRFRFDLAGADLAASRQAHERHQVRLESAASVLQQSSY